MPTMVCPNCGYEQESGTQCRKCGSLSAYYEQPSPQDRPQSSPQMAPRSVGHGVARATNRADNGGRVSFLQVLRKVYQAIQWSSLAILIVTIALALRKSPPPQIPTDPQAAARAEAKLRDSEVAAQAGQPHELQLDKTELNSFLSSNLALAGGAAAAGNPQAPAPQVANPSPSPDAGAGNSAASPTAAVPGGTNGEREPSLEEVQSSVKDVKVDMDGDLVKAYIVFDFHGKDLSLEVEGHLGAQDGYLRFEPTRGMLGSLPLPQSALDSAVSRLLTSPENREKMRLPADISDLRVADGHLVVNYK